MKIIPIAQAKVITAGVTQTSKMPCKSYSLPTLACKTGYEMAKIEGSICASCYATKGFYRMYEGKILPVQMARLESILDPLWCDSMVALIGKDAYFRWHDSGDVQSVEHLELIANVCDKTPNCLHWLPTREYSIIKQYIDKHGKLPDNLMVRLSAMYPDVPVKVPASLRGIANVTTSEVHHKKPANVTPCNAPAQNGACLDCRLCWTDSPVSYAMH